MTRIREIHHVRHTALLPPRTQRPLGAPRRILREEQPLKEHAGSTITAICMSDAVKYSASSVWARPRTLCGSRPSRVNVRSRTVKVEAQPLEARRAPAPSRALSGILAVLTFVVTLAWYTELAELSLRTISLWSLFATASAFVFLTRRSLRGFWSASSIFMLVAMCFHQGLLIYSALDIAPTFDGQTGLWYTTFYTKQAAVIVTASLTAYGLSAAALAGRIRADEDAEPLAAGDRAAGVFGFGGFAALTLAVAAWFLYTASALGAGFVLTSYERYLRTTAGQPLPYIFYLIGLGLVVAVASGSPKWRKRTIIVFTIFALAALPIGLRGEVLFPAAAAAAVFARRSKLPRGLIVVALLVVLLSGIHALQQLRTEGLGGTTLGEITASPLRGVAELGGSLRTVQAVASWRAVDGPENPHGSTYAAPFDRAIAGRLLGQTQPPAASDMRLLNVEMRTRETTIGGSFIAEAYRNFGLLGALLIPALIGLGLGAFDRRRSTVVTDAMLGVVLVALLQHVRNSFAPTPAQIVIGLVFVAALSVWSKASTPRA